MAGMVGMNIEEVRRIAGQLKGQAGQIDTLISQINGLIEQTQANWRGEDATRFKGWWEGEHRPNLMRLREAIDGLGQSALNNASEQEAASRS